MISKFPAVHRNSVPWLSWATSAASFRGPPCTSWIQELWYHPRPLGLAHALQWSRTGKTCDKQVLQKSSVLLLFMVDPNSSTSEFSTSLSSLSSSSLHNLLNLDQGLWAVQIHPPVQHFSTPGNPFCKQLYPAFSIFNLGGHHWTPSISFLNSLLLFIGIYLPLLSGPASHKLFPWFWVPLLFQSG